MLYSWNFYTQTHLMKLLDNLYYPSRLRQKSRVLRDLRGLVCDIGWDASNTVKEFLRIITVINTNALKTQEKRANFY